MPNLEKHKNKCKCKHPKKLGVQSGVTLLLNLSCLYAVQPLDPLDLKHFNLTGGVLKIMHYVLH